MDQIEVIMDSPAKLDVKKILEHTRYLSDECGARWFGTPGNHKARTYIESVFSEMSLPVTKQTFEEESVEILSYKVSVLDPPLGEISAVPVQNTKDTPPDGLIGDVVYVEGLQAPQVGKHLEGQVVLWMPERVMPIPMEILQCNPAAVIVISPSPGLPPRHDHYPNSASVPFGTVTSFKISLEDGIRLMKSGAKKIHLQLRSRKFRGELCNLIAEIKGSRYPDEIILIGAHYDSPPNVAGAMDNATGVGVMLELARAYVDHGSKRTLRFVAWDGEEPGALGSGYYLKQLKTRDMNGPTGQNFESQPNGTEVDKHRFCMNLDTLGAILGYHVCSVNANHMVEAYLKGLCGELGIPVQMSRDYYGSDHDMFAWNGIPSVNLSRMGPAFQYIHTDADTMNNIGELALEEGGKIASFFLQHVAADAETWVFDREVPEHQLKQIAEWVKMLGLQPES